MLENGLTQFMQFRAQAAQAAHAVHASAAAAQAEHLLRNIGKIYKEIIDTIKSSYIT